MRESEWLERFVAESDRIEGIEREPTPAEIDAHRVFLGLEAPTVEGLQALVAVLQPDARLRDDPSVPGVRVGSHIAPPSGPEIAVSLSSILRCVDSWSPFALHRRYESLHPFTDGNGRSGRALWLLMMLRSPRAEQAKALGFLHSWYYQSLEAAR